MFADTFVSAHTMVVSLTDPNVCRVLKREPRSAKLESVSSVASNRQNCAPSLSLPHPTPRYQFCFVLLLSPLGLSGYWKARVGSRKPVLIRGGLTMDGPRCCHLKKRYANMCLGLHAYITLPGASSHLFTKKDPSHPTTKLLQLFTSRANHPWLWQTPPPHSSGCPCCRPRPASERKRPTLSATDCLCRC